jgi:adenine-specific DNA-methyltransferase
MKLIPVTPAKSLNKAYFKQSIKRDQIELLKANLVHLFERIRAEEHEEHLKNLVADFLKDTWYKPAFEINTSKRTDLVIHTGKSSDDPIGVIIETKKPSNRAEMITPERPNAKALHELLHYYMQERYIRDNKEIKHLIICNIYEWYIFDAADFERFFFGNHKLVKSYKDWNDGLLVSANTDWFYQEIAKPFIEKELVDLPCVCFDLHDFEKIVRKPDKVDDKKLINLYKILSPPHLLKQPFANDSNSLNKEFYGELLHIIGLEEVKEKGKKLIRRKAEGERQEGSLLENTINVLRTRNKLVAEQLKSDAPLQGNDPYFETALELCINWLDRLLFLKLLEGQLIAYHRGDRAYTFLNSNRIADFDELNELFFEVLAVRVAERSPSVQAKFGNIPYLNSSLFEESDLERATIRINELKNRLDLPLYGATVLKGGSGKRLTGNKNTLTYLFEFLDAYDFSTEGSAEIQEQNKTIINASVLGLIFEKINGYKDGSFFTPGFITMYICRETIRRAVLRKFNDKYGWACSDINELYNRIDPGKLKEANETVNSLKICDPAVGSGHFLVSALNEIIAVKSDLGILADKDGKRLREYAVSVENDELIVTHDEQLFSYNYRDPESQRVQETLFHEKETIIENCLFGVDINPKSVAICRLRLWIELLKNAYYRRGTDELETLPNIDINIKCGNSLISRFAVAGNPNTPAVQRKKLKELTAAYSDLVLFYKHSPSNKAELRKRIDNLKHDLENFGLPNDKDLVALRKKENEVAQLGFAFDKKGTEARQKLLAEVAMLQERFAEKERLMYANAFEWRFEFPEVLDDAGEFIGFDAVIGNPPYIRIQDLKECAPNEVTLYKTRYISASKGNYDIYVMFVELSLTLLSDRGRLSFILPHKFFNAQYGEPLRKHIAAGAHLSKVVHFGHEMVFEEAAAYTCLMFLSRQRSEAFQFIKVDNLNGWRQGIDGTAVEGTIPSINATAADWNFAAGGSEGLQSRLSEMPQTLEQVTERIFQGLKTSADKIYIVEELERSEGNVRIFSPEKRAEFLLEPDLLHPLVKGGDSSAYRLERTSRTIIFPYETNLEGAMKLISEASLKERYPLTWAYFESNRVYLESRENGKMRHAGWYGYVYPKALNVMSRPKIFTPDLAPKPRFSLDVTGECFFTGGAAGGYGILVKEEYDRRYILGILNSRLSGWFIGQTATQMRGGWHSYEARFIRHIPIANVTDAQKFPIIDRVEKILADPESPDVPRLETEIDRLVYDLYGLTEEDIALVEGKA